MPLSSWPSILTVWLTFGGKVCGNLSASTFLGSHQMWVSPSAASSALGVDQPRDAILPVCDVSAWVARLLQWFLHGCPWSNRMMALRCPVCLGMTALPGPGGFLANQDGLLILISAVTTASWPDGSAHGPMQLLLEDQTMRMAFSRGLPILADKSTVRLGWEETSGQVLTCPTLGLIKGLLHHVWPSTRPEP